jgi:tetratricopeptide (TPR) repeat protein
MPAPYAPPQGTIAYGSATQLGVAPGHAAPPQQTYAAPVPLQDPALAQKRRTMLTALFGGAVVLAAVFAVGAAFQRAYQNSQVYSGAARVTEDMNAAASLYNSGQYEKAAAEFQRLRRGGNMTALTYEAFCYRQLGHQAQKAGDFQKAQQYYNQALAINPGDSQARVEADAAGKVIVGLATPGPSTATPEPIRTTEWPKAPAPGTPNMSAADFQSANARSEQAAQTELGAGDAAWQRGDREEAYRRWNAAIRQGVGTQASVTASQRLAQYGGQ